MLNLHHLKDSKAHLYINILNKSWSTSNGQMRKSKETHGGGWLSRIGFCREGSFELFTEGGDRSCSV